MGADPPIAVGVVVAILGRVFDPIAKPRLDGSLFAVEAVGLPRELEESARNLCRRQLAERDFTELLRPLRVGGKRQSVYVGRSADGTTRADAERTLAYELERVRRGEWTPAPVQEVREMPSFREAASDWLAARRSRAGATARA